MNCVIAENITLGYGNEPIIKNLNVTIPKYKITSIIGANGCGKSTLLKGMSRILVPESGRILVDGMNINKSSPKAIAKKIAVLPQTPKAPSGLKVQELVAFGRFPHKSGFGALNKEDFEIINESMEDAGIIDFRERRLEELSGGQRQRAWIAMALCQKTEILLLDEPTTYLDLSHQFDVLSLLLKLNQEKRRTIVMVLHEINHASRFSDNIIAMKKGCVISEGSPRQVITTKNLKNIFNIYAEIIDDKINNRPMYLSYERAERKACV